MAAAIKPIDYKVLLNNITAMINLLEFDAMRSAGKAKLNSGNIVDLYVLKDRYEKELESTAPPEPIKRTVGRPAVKKPE